MLLFNILDVTLISEFSTLYNILITSVIPSSKGDISYVLYLFTSAFQTYNASFTFLFISLLLILDTANFILLSYLSFLIFLQFSDAIIEDFYLSSFSGVHYLLVFLNFTGLPSNCILSVELQTFKFLFDVIFLNLLCGNDLFLERLLLYCITFLLLYTSFPPSFIFYLLFFTKFSLVISFPFNNSSHDVFISSSLDSLNDTS